MYLARMIHERFRCNHHPLLHSSSVVVREARNGMSVFVSSLARYNSHGTLRARLSAFPEPPGSGRLLSADTPPLDVETALRAPVSQSRSIHWPASQNLLPCDGALSHPFRSAPGDFWRIRSRNPWPSC